MRRYFESLRPADLSAIHSVPDGIFLVRVDRAQYRWHKQKPYYEIRFAVLKPKHLTECFMTGRLYCTPRAIWKLSWFLREFGYDAELLGTDGSPVPMTLTGCGTGDFQSSAVGAPACVSPTIFSLGI
jgi:hypothetical protein